VQVDELEGRTGATAGMRWQQWSERVLPALSLGIRADHARSHARLKDRDAWAAAIVARTLGLWTDGPPPTLPKVCDALTWRALGLGSTPKQCPAEVRSHFLRTYIDSDAGTPEKLVRQLAARATSALRPDLRAFHVALIAGWLAGRELAPREPSLHEPPPRDLPPCEPSLVDAVRHAAREAREGLFGDRKVFISSIWHALRAEPPWSALGLEDFKAQLVTAHRSQKLELARADLVAAMDPALVASSETRTDGATFHFIVKEPLQ
jgi:hypothetical protein